MVMRQSRWRLLLTRFWAVWFATAMLSPSGTRGCVMHAMSMHAKAADGAAEATNAAAVAAAASLETSPAPVAHAGHAHHASAEPAPPTGSHTVPHVGSPEGSDQAVPDDAPNSGGHRCCTCIGECGLAPLAAEVPTVTIALYTELRVQSVLPFVDVPTAYAPRPPHALPFANGPPVGTRA